MKDDLPTLKLDKLFIFLSIMTDRPVNTHNTQPKTRGISSEMQNRNYERCEVRSEKQISITLTADWWWWWCYRLH